MSDDERLGRIEDAQPRQPKAPQPARVLGNQRPANPREATAGAMNASERVSQEREAGEREYADDREYSDEERLEMFRAANFQSVLPDLPHRAGFHPIWLTTQNPRDSLSSRMRLGYRIARLEDCPGWDGITMKAGDVAGAIAVNEMVGAYLPLRLYHLYMMEAHHNAPAREEQKLRATVDEMREQLERAGSRVEVGDPREGANGMDQYSQPRARSVPVFTQP